MGRISDDVKYPLDGSISGNEILIGSDGPAGATRNYSLSGQLLPYISANIDYIKGGNNINAIYDGYIIITRAGVSKDPSKVQIGDMLIGMGSFSSGSFVIMIAEVENPTVVDQTTGTGLRIILNLGS